MLFFIRIFIFLSTLAPISAFAMECGQCDSKGENCRSVDCSTDPCNGGGNSHYCNYGANGSVECFTCPSSGHDHDVHVHCEVGYKGTTSAGKIFVTKDGTVCTESEVLLATALWGQWTEGDKFLEGTQATLAGVIKILALFGSDWGIYKHLDKNLKTQCALEYIEGVCKLENIDHYCFKDFRKGSDNNEPRLRFKSEERRQEVADFIKKMSQAGFIGPMR